MGTDTIKLSAFQYGERMAKQRKGAGYYNPYQNKTQAEQFKLGWDAWLKRNT